MSNFYVLHSKHTQEMASTERGWNSISLSIYHCGQTKDNSPECWPPSLQWCCWVDMFSLGNLCLHKMYRPLYPSPWLWYVLMNSSKLFTQSWDLGVEEVIPAPLQFCRSCWGSPRFFSLSRSFEGKQVFAYAFGWPGLGLSMEAAAMVSWIWERE